MWYVLRHQAMEILLLETQAEALKHGAKKNYYPVGKQGQFWF